MKRKAERIPLRLIITMAILLLLIVFVNVAQSSLGRYTSSFGEELTFSPKAKGEFELTCGEWTAVEGEGSKTLTLNLTSVRGNTDEEETDFVRVRLYVPGTDAVLPTLFLNYNGEKYAALVSDIPEGTAVHKNYGSGRIYRFYGADGGELFLEIPKSDTENLNMTLILDNEEINTTGFQVIVEPVNAKNGGDRL